MLKGKNSTPFIFLGLNQDQLKLVEPLVELRKYSADAVIFNQGQQATHLFIVARGEIVINFKPYDGPWLTISHLKEGGICGWSSTLGRDVYNSTAVAVTDCEVYCMSGQKLRSLCERHPDAGVVILEKLASAIAEGLESTHTQIMGILSEGMDLRSGEPGKGK